MAVADPHALPETEAACADYLAEADQAWDAHDTERAYALYHSLFMAHLRSEEQRSHAAFRLGSMLNDRGYPSRAFDFLRQSHEPGARELLESIESTRFRGEHQQPHPGHVPWDPIEIERWTEAAEAASAAGEYERAAGLYRDLANSFGVSEEMGARAQVLSGQNLLAAGHPDTARDWLEQALPRLTDEADIEQVQELLRRIGGSVADDASSPGAHQVAVGRQAYEAGDAGAARSAFEAALQLDGPDTARGRAHYYLGAMDYQAGHYAQARDHLEAAAADAPSPEGIWARSMLALRWEDTGRESDPY